MTAGGAYTVATVGPAAGGSLTAGLGLYSALPLPPDGLEAATLTTRSRSWPDRQIVNGAGDDRPVRVPDYLRPRLRGDVPDAAVLEPQMSQSLPSSSKFDLTEILETS
jgi:hypothetical protein